MSRHHRRWGATSLAAAAGLVIAGTVWGLGAGSEPAAANGTDGQFCTANQVTATMVRETGNSGLRAARSYGAIQIRAKRGEACHVVGAPEATLRGVNGAVQSDDSPPRRVLVTPQAPAWLPVDWADEASPSAQRIPRSITLDLPGSPDLVVPWTGGGVDVVMEPTPVALRGVQTGVAPFHYGR